MTRMMISVQQNTGQQIVVHIWWHILCMVSWSSMAIRIKSARISVLLHNILEHFCNLYVCKCNYNNKNVFITNNLKMLIGQNCLIIIIKTIIIIFINMMIELQKYIAQQNHVLILWEILLFIQVYMVGFLLIIDGITPLYIELNKK